jgi:hypothetical protein
VNENLEVVSEELVISDILDAPTTGSAPYYWGNVTTQIRWNFWTWR